MHVVNLSVPVVAMASAVVFAGVYSLVARWWLSVEGRLLFGFSAVVFLHGLHELMALLVTAGSDAVGALAFGLSTVLMLRFTALAWTVQIVAPKGASGGRKSG